VQQSWSERHRKGYTTSKWRARGERGRGVLQKIRRKKKIGGDINENCRVARRQRELQIRRQEKRQLFTTRTEIKKNCR
jgi:hypothetical protein